MNFEIIDFSKICYFQYGSSFLPNFAPQSGGDTKSVLNGVYIV